jgi:hypothetical protein
MIQQAAVLNALKFVKSRYPFWNHSNGTNHVWVLAHDFGGCLRERDFGRGIPIALKAEGTNPSMSCLTLNTCQM